MKRLVALIGLILAVLLPPARAQQTPDDQYVAIYTLMQQADSLQGAGQPRAALADYTQAQAALQRLQKVYPDWDPKIVGFRLDYLARRISDLTAQVPATNAPPAAPATASTAVTDTASPAGALQEQVRNLQSANEELQAKLKEALREQPALADTQALAAAEAKVRSLMKENDLLQAGLQSGTASNAATQELLKMRQALTDANRKLTEETGRADRAVRENQALQARLQPLLADTNALEALREENALLKKQVAGLTAAGADAGAGPAKARADVAVSQSDADINWLEKTALENRLRQVQSAPAAATSPEMSDELKTLRARLAVEEAPAVPYTPEELALLKPSTPPAAPIGAAAKPMSELPGGSAELVAEAQNYFAAGEYGKAEADYQKILAAEPSNALALANLAAIEMQENKLADAETHIKTALAQNPDDAYDLSTLGYLKFRQEKYDDALDALSRAARLDPGNAEIQNYLGVTLSHKGLHTAAETALRKAIELAPNYGAAHNNLAVVYLSETPPLAALARWHYQKALDLGQPHNPDLEKLLSENGAPVGQ